MARIVNSMINPSPGATFATMWAWWLVLLLGGGVLSLVVVTTVTRATSKRGRRGGSSSSRAPAEVEEEIVEDVPIDPPRRSQRETDFRATYGAYVKSLPGRGFINERQIDVDSLGHEFPGVTRIASRGMDFWFLQLGKFSGVAVLEFYSNIQPKLHREAPENDFIRARVGGKTIVITPDGIAAYLDYERPNNPNYPNYPELVIPTQTINEALYVNPRDYRGTHKPGSFKEEYRLINKAIHVNLFPRGQEHRPSNSSAELLYAFMTEEYTIDCARFIFDQLVNFVDMGSTNLRIPFPCMISTFCHNQGVNGPPYEDTESLHPGPIDAQNMHKSRAHSRPSTSTSQVREAFATPPKPHSSIKSWLKKLFCQNIVIHNDQREIKKRLSNVERQQGRLSAELSWQSGQIGGVTHHRYMPPPEEVEEGEQGDGPFEVPYIPDSDDE